MKKIFYFILLLSVASCAEEEGPLGESGNINLNINAEYDGEPLVIGQGYPFDGKQLKLDHFDFYISNVTLLEAETSDETDLMEVALVDFSDHDTPGKDEPESFTFKVVPAVKYRGLKISIGVPSGLNKSSVSAYGSGHPLKQTFESHYWVDGGSFFFSKLAGVYDLNGDGNFGNAPDDNTFELFPAKNSNFMPLELLKEFTLKNGETLDLNLVLDVKKLLQTADNQPISLADPANLSTYNPENDDLSSLLMGNFEPALELE